MEEQKGEEEEEMGEDELLRSGAKAKVAALLIERVENGKEVEGLLQQWTSGRGAEVEGELLDQAQEEATNGYNAMGELRNLPCNLPSLGGWEAILDLRMHRVAAIWHPG